MNLVRGRIIPVSIAVLLLGIPVVSFYSSIFSIKDCVFTFDQTLSQSLCDQITAHVQVMPITANKKMVDDIKGAFPILSSVAIKQRNSGQVHIVCTAHEPLFVVNSTQALLPNNALVNYCSFRPYVLEPLSSFSVVLTDSLSAPEGLATWAEKIPSQLMERYEITWFDQTKIELVDKQNEKISLLLQGTNQVDESLLDY